MRTPAGKECRYFYGDYFRGRKHEECRLLAPAGLHWTPDLCATCPVPGIVSANACQFMNLTPAINRPFPFIKRKVQVRAYCTKTNRAVQEPHVGCGECHPLPSVFEGIIGDPDSSS